MIRLLGFFIKTLLFSAVILILGNWIKWDGKSISSQIQSRMTRVEKSPATHKVRNWTEEAIRSAKEVARDVTSNVSDRASELGSATTDVIKTKRAHPLSAEKVAPDSDIPASERQKLKALIRELNSSPH